MNLQKDLREFVELQNALDFRRNRAASGRLQDFADLEYL
jgi:hypothetical protein